MVCSLTRPVRLQAVGRALLEPFKEGHAAGRQMVVSRAVVGRCLGGQRCCPKALTWQEVRDKFEAANPTLRAGQIGIDESRAQEITANLRPNPNLTILADQIDPFNGGPSHGPFAYLLSSGSVN